MITAAKIHDLINEGQALEQLAEIYTELSVQKLQKVRQKIESNREFVSDLAQVYHIIREAAIRQGIPLGEKKGALSILLTSNHPLYGNLETQLTSFFMAHSGLNYGDLAVIGRTGAQYLRDFRFRFPFNSFVFHDDLPTLQELTDFASSLTGYERVLVYHSKLQSIIIQRPIVTEVSGFVSPNPSANENFYYILEPETTKMLQFFDTQIVKLLLEQVFLEAELARTGARLILMDEAKQRAEAFITSQKGLLNAVERSDRNAKMLEMTLAAISRRQVGDS